MPSEETIVQELRLISVCVAAISRQTPYQAPDGYFDGLEDKIMSRLKQNPYTVPQGFFEEFAGKLLTRIKAGQHGDTREELSVLSPLLDRIDKQHPFEAPAGYFNDLTGNVLSGVKAIEFVNDELENLPSLINGLQDKPAYQAPEGYFDRFAGTVLAKLKEEQYGRAVVSPGRPATVISINRVGKVWKYAAAAVMAGLILTGGWLGFHNPGHPEPAASNDLARSTDLSQGLAQVSDQEIVNYLDNQNIPLAETMTNSTATLDINDADVKSILGNVSDDELKQYMDDNGGTKDLVTN
jgi:hypothetical protein